MIIKFPCCQLKKLTDQSVLAKIAINISLRMFAWRPSRDSRIKTLLAKIVIEEQFGNHEVGLAVVEKLT